MSKMKHVPTILVGAMVAATVFNPGPAKAFEGSAASVINTLMRERQFRKLDEIAAQLPPDANAAYEGLQRLRRLGAPEGMITAATAKAAKAGHPRAMVSQAEHVWFYVNRAEGVELFKNAAMQTADVAVRGYAAKRLAELLPKEAETWKQIAAEAAMTERIDTLPE